MANIDNCNSKHTNIIKQEPINNLKKTTNYNFENLKLSNETLKYIKSMGYKEMTEIQAKTFPIIMTGKDLIGAAKTGSGKTLAFLIPVVEILKKVNFKQRNGCGILIISPTRELALQLYNILNELSKFHSYTCGIVIGGTNISKERKKLTAGVNILVSTPGRLLDHLKNTRNFIFKNLISLIIDEADKILDIGFEKQIIQIINLLPKDRQTLLFSATQTKKTKDLAKISLKKNAVYIGVDDNKPSSTREGLDQGYIIIPSSDRFLLLFTFLKKNLKKKIIVFFMTCNCVKYYKDLLNYVDIPVLGLYGKLSQNKRTSTFFEFVNAKYGILLSTDVAARGLDIPKVDWIIQFDPPDNPKSYIHRVGRTARGLNGKGKAIIFLLPEEKKYLKLMMKLKVHIKEFEFNKDRIVDIQTQLENIIENNYHLANLAKKAFKSYLQAYSQMNYKIFDVYELDILSVAKSFGFDNPPRVNVNVGLKGKRARNRLFKKELINRKPVKQFCR